MLRPLARGAVCPGGNELSAASLLLRAEGARGEETRLLEGDGTALIGSSGRHVADLDGAGVGWIESAELAEQRRLAAPVRSEHGDDLAGGHDEVDVVEHVALAEAPPDAPQTDQQNQGGAGRRGGHVTTLGLSGVCLPVGCDGAGQRAPFVSLSGGARLLPRQTADSGERHPHVARRARRATAPAGRSRAPPFIGYN